jgi:hypothetical protein
MRAWRTETWEVVRLVVVLFFSFDFITTTTTIMTITRFD